MPCCIGSDRAAGICWAAVCRARSDDAARREPAAQQSADAIDVPARPHDHAGTVGIIGTRYVSQVQPPLFQQPVERYGYIRAGNARGELESAGGSPGQLQRILVAVPVLAGTDCLRLSVCSGDREDRTAVGTRLGSCRCGQQRIGRPPPSADVGEQRRDRTGGLC